MTFRALLATLLAILFTMYLRQPHRELDWTGEIFPMARRFADAESSDFHTPLAAKVVVITGCTSGIGLGLARAFAKLGAKVVAIARSDRKLSSLQEELPSVITVKADLGDLSSVSQGAGKILETLDRIDILINNAGMFEKNFLKKDSTPQGHDRVFTVNYLSHFLLTLKLSPILTNATIVHTVSSHWIENTMLFS